MWHKDLRDMPGAVTPHSSIVLNRTEQTTSEPLREMGLYASDDTYLKQGGNR